MGKISIVVPVHNGSEWIQKLVKNILNQDYKDIEILLIENFSKDDSWKIINDIQNSFPQIVKVFQCTNKGTSQARRMGIEYASGEYIIFADQDDSYVSKSSIRKMYEVIREDGSEIVQFGFFIDDVFGIKRRKIADSQKHIYSREQFIKEQVGGIIGCGIHTNSNFTVQIWNKIFKTDLLKDAANKITDELYYAEDMNLCLHAFFSEKMHQVSYHPECFYAWKKGIGFSSGSGSGWTLMNEYRIVKPYIFSYARKYGISDEILWWTHLETLYLFKGIIDERIGRSEDSSEIKSIIFDMLNMEHVQAAKMFYRNYHGEQKSYDELDLLYEDHTPEEYYNYCSNEIQGNKGNIKKETIKRFYSAAMQATRFFQRHF